MLVLTRGIDEGILIGDEIRITVVRVSGGVVRIGIEAPPDATIMRGELLSQYHPPDEEVDSASSPGRR